MRQSKTTMMIGLAALLPLAAQAAPKTAARITPAQAEAAATKRIPGQALAAKYEFEDGHWQYAVTVKTKSGQLYEAEVNSTTGLVTATEKTSVAEEKAEAAADKKAAMHSHMKGHATTAPENGEKGEKSNKSDKGEKGG